jgi:hypothetical protein
MNFMALWAIVGGQGIGSIVTSLLRSRAWNRHKQLSIWCGVTVATIMLIVAFIATLNLKESEVEDERISRLDPAFNTMHFAPLAKEQSNFIVTMEPLVIQMYADPTTRIVDLESVDSGSLQTLISTNSDSHLIFLKEANRLSDDDVSRYGKQIRYLLSRPSSILLNTDRFQVLSVDLSSRVR